MLRTDGSFPNRYMVLACEGPCTMHEIWNDGLFKVAGHLCHVTTMLKQSRCLQLENLGCSGGQDLFMREKRLSVRDEGG